MRALILLLLTACGDRPAVIVDADRSEFFFNRPFPSDELLTEAGTIDLSDFPVPEANLGATMVGGWARMATESVHGFSHLAPIYIRLTGPVDVEETYESATTDDIRLISLSSEHRVPVRVRFVADSNDDPFIGNNTLIIAPDPRYALRSGEVYAAILHRRFVDPPEDFTVPPGLEDEPRVGFATTFTVQDSLGQLHQLLDRTDALLDANPEYLQPTNWREVASIDFAPAQTPSGRDATRFTTTYTEGGTEVTWLADRTGQATYTVDLSTSPMRVFEARIQTIAWRPLEDLPYASPGIGFLSDFGRSDGRIRFDADGTLIGPGEPESMRIVVQIPRDAPATALFTWDHGTAGHAYSAVQHQTDSRRSQDISAVAAQAGVAIISRDQPLYGQRYPLIDEGFDASLGFYNIANLPAFRDNQRQGAVDHHVLYRFATEVLPTLDVGVEAGPVGSFGHSLGSVTAHIGLVMAPNEDAESSFMSGSGGFLSNYVVETGLLGSENDVVQLLEGLVEADLPDNPNGSEAVGALMGIPEESWPLVDDMHPIFALFQTIMDPSDPLALAGEQPAPEVFLMGIGDRQVPNKTTEWLVEALPAATKNDCQALSDYDPHSCTFVEDEGIAAVQEWIEALAN